MPPFAANRLETVAHHGLPQYHAVAELLLGNPSVRDIMPCRGVAAERWMALLAEPVEVMVLRLDKPPRACFIKNNEKRGIYGIKQGIS